MDNFSYIEELHQAWHGDRGAVSPGWDAYFSDLHAAARRPAPAAEEGADGRGADMVYKQGRVDSLLWAYRDVGYLYADLNPLAAPHAQEACELSPHSNGDYEQLELEDFGLSEEDLDTSFAAGRAMTPSRAPLRDIVAAYRETYCASIGVEFLHIQNRDIRHWLVQQMESCRNQAELGRAEKRIFLEDLIKAEEFERFLGLHFVGQKRFSLEGAEVVIPALHSLVNWGAHANQIEQIVIGTTHRGRLSVLRHILDLAPEEITSEFEENYGPGVYHGTGDVKYHLGYSTDHVHADGSQVHLSLVPNPSHLESVDPVVEGKVRAVQEQIGDVRRQRVLPVLLHGDAAFSGQGVVAETLNLSQLEGYRTGGTIHIVINNQIGFTTPARHGRSGFFPTDIVKMLPIPVFHVNGDDPEAIIHVMKLALTFRQTFHQDVVVDIFCFRRYGHNEGDEPSFTHPCMYRLVRKHPGVAALYGERCEAAGVMEAAEQSQIRESVQGELRDALERTRAGEIRRLDLSQGGAWEGIGTTYSFDPVQTAVSEEQLRHIVQGLTAVPEDFHMHPKLARIVERKLKHLDEAGTIDWALAEALAFGSLLLEGVPVRLSGEDSARGTFAQRHLVWWDSESSTPTSHMPIGCLAEDQARFQVFDSPLSEYSILGFEYGYSLAQPNALVIWEAQFGDFANGAQVVIDNYIVAGETRWRRFTGLVLLLPHGCEGQGPDHSSARLERFLQLCAEENLEVCNPTTPAQYFHLLRRQVTRGFRKPLVVMAPKSLLRHPAAVSPLHEFADSCFQLVLDDPSRRPEAERILLCSGKIYYDLLARREETGADDTALVRVEQLCPFPTDELRRILGSYESVREIIWVQEEHRNQGAWMFFSEQFSVAFPGRELRYLGRPENAGTATGRGRQHREEQETLMNQCFQGKAASKKDKR